MIRLPVFLIALTLSGPLVAGSGDPVVTEPEPVAPAAETNSGGDWTGFFLGGQIGRLDADLSGGLAGGDDLSYGLHAGYDHDFGRFVLGGEIDYDAMDVGIAGGAQNIDLVLRLKFRAGYDLGNTMLYATIGAAQMDSSLGEEDGTFGGIGVNYAISDSFTLGGEFLTHSFDNINGSGIDADANTLTFRGSFRF